MDEWSLAVFAALSAWPRTSSGTWTRWEPGYLLLTIEKVDGREVEPILIHSADEEVEVAFGYWEYLAGWQGTDGVSATDAAGEVITLVERWLAGDVRTAVYRDAANEWCGSKLIEGGDWEAQLREGAQWLRDFRPTLVELRSPRKEDWRTVIIHSSWLVPPPPRPWRLP